MRTPEEILSEALSIAGNEPYYEPNRGYDGSDEPIMDAIKIAQTEAYNQALIEFKEKLISMRLTESEMKELDIYKTFEAYGLTGCINDLLEWIKTK